MTNVFALMWKYSDNSAFGVVRVFINRDPADELRLLLTEHSGTREFWIEIVEMQEQ